jgi:carbon monoxide dehydrogenase subunit G
MHLSATYVFNAPIETVWALLMDTGRIAGCLPGCTGLRPIGEDRYEAELAVVVAAISGNFKGTVALKDKDAPRSYRLLVEGSGRPGFVKGTAQISLTPNDAQTTVQIEADAEAGGMIARVGQRLLEGVGRMMMDRFFGCLSKQAETPSTTSP